MKRALPFLALFVASFAYADVPGGGDLVLAGDFGISYQHVSSQGSVDLLRIAPSLDYLVTPNFTVGAALAYVHASAGDQSLDDFEAIPRIGFFAPVGPAAFFWGRAGIGYVRGLADVVGVPVSGDFSINRVVVSAELLLGYSPVPHFMIAGGPILHQDISTSVSGDNVPEGAQVDKLTTIGVEIVIGGYF